jgi:hypothetical protein
VDPVAPANKAKLAVSRKYFYIRASFAQQHGRLESALPCTHNYDCFL